VLRQKEILLRVLTVSIYLIALGLMVWRREIPAGLVPKSMLIALSSLLPFLSTVAFFVASRTTAVTVGYRMAYCGFITLALFPLGYFISGGETIGLMGIGFIGLGLSIGALLPQEKINVARNMGGMPSTKIIYVEADQLRTSDTPVVKQLRASETAIEIIGDRPIKFSDIQSISQERMSGSGTFIKVQTANRTVFISAIRWHFFGHIFVVNYFKTQAIFNYLNGRCFHRTDA
jgi:hypothetical protein